ncbi:M18 family aminopeptidase [Aggregicoccus sp. 17bor-14]|uniref:M18 family aminopeptidase n=1 Tax=Myxococcaceae TaxID=31 RepID=UPI00129CAD5B|nr:MULTISPECIES: M18 family aminopeptidase [Myxococcaceae]MBF5045502.1 M18 family aminopeptidase [Simulacricoccus sp. 17bor-14]MRI91239.1 M18 family aminopeptidase [Aggregicoccus sp. 17bor-14]
MTSSSSAPAAPGAPASVADDLLRYIDASPTPYHAVNETVRRLELQGYRHLDEREPWQLRAGDKVYVVRGGTSVVAFHLGRSPLTRAGFRLVGSHTDSPNLRVKPQPHHARAGVHQLGVEVYGGVLWHTWLDRDLSLAGRVLTLRAGVQAGHLVDFGRKSLLRIPNLAIHLNRQVNTEGLKLNPQEHLVPLFALEAGGPVDLRALLAEQLSASHGAVAGPYAAADVVGWDLCLYDVQPSTRSGLRGEFLHAPRLDNLASCHAALTALLSVQGTPEATCGVVLYDHEEVGSTSAQGAASPFLRHLLERLVMAHGDGQPDAFHRVVRRSWMVSADMAHALHPNYADRHEPRHAPILGKGPVLKSNVNQSYATDGEGWALWEGLCREAGVVPQHFVTRTDLPCGSTIGPLTAGELGMPTVDVGGPMLSMHSIREMAAASDVEAMVAVLRQLFR